MITRRGYCNDYVEGTLMITREVIVMITRGGYCNDYVGGYSNDYEGRVL